MPVQNTTTESESGLESSIIAGLQCLAVGAPFDSEKAHTCMSRWPDSTDPRLIVLRRLTACVRGDYDAAAEVSLARTEDSANRIVTAWRLGKIGQPYDAVNALGNIEHESPYRCLALLCQGRIYEELKQPRIAAGSYQQAAAADPTSELPWIAQAKLARSQGQLPKAVEYAREANRRADECFDTLVMLGDLLARLASGNGVRKMAALTRQLREEAAACFRKAVSLRPSADLHVQLGQLHYRLTNFEAARMAFQQARKLDPECCTALEGLGNLSLDDGNLDQAAAYLEHALQLNPALARAHFRLSRLKKHTDSPETQRRIAQLQQLIAENGDRHRDLIEYNFALGKIFSDINCSAQAWHHYDTANRLKPGHCQTIAQSEARGQHLQKLVSETRSSLTRTFFEQRPAYGRLSQRPVFVIGMPRSGTTLVEQILSAHPAVFGAGELKHVGTIRDQLVAEYKTESLPTILRELRPGRCHDLAEFYLDHLRRLSPSAERVVDKMPTNFLYTGLIALLLPKARFIHCLRDPRDIFLSCYFQNLDAPFCDLTQLRNYYNCYRQMMDHWRDVLPGRIETIQYELLVSDVEQYARRMTDFCGISWDKRCLDFQDNLRPVRTPSKVQVRQPVYRTSVARWKRFEKQLQPHLEGLDIPPEYRQ